MTPPSGPPLLEPPSTRAIASAPASTPAFAALDEPELVEPELDAPPDTDEDPAREDDPDDPPPESAPELEPGRGPASGPEEDGDDPHAPSAEAPNVTSPFTKAIRLMTA